MYSSRYTRDPSPQMSMEPVSFVNILAMQTTSRRKGIEVVVKGIATVGEADFVSRAGIARTPVGALAQALNLDKTQCRAVLAAQDGVEALRTLFARMDPEIAATHWGL